MVAFPFFCLSAFSGCATSWASSGFSSSSSPSSFSAVSSLSFSFTTTFSGSTFSVLACFFKTTTAAGQQQAFSIHLCLQVFYFYRLLRPFFFWHTLCTHHPTTANGHDARNTFAATTFVAWWTKSKMDSLPRLVLCNLFSLQPFQASAQACLGSAYPLNLFAGCPSWPLSLFSGLLLLLACLSIFRMVCIKFLRIGSIFHQFSDIDAFSTEMTCSCAGCSLFPLFHLCSACYRLVQKPFFPQASCC